MKISTQITEGDFTDWKLHPITEALMKYSAAKKQRLMERWADGEFSDGFDVGMAVKNAGATGACSIYKDLLELDFEELIGELDDGEYIRVVPKGQSGSDSELRAGDGGGEDNDS